MHHATDSLDGDETNVANYTNTSSSMDKAGSAIPPTQRPELAPSTPRPFSNTQLILPKRAGSSMSSKVFEELRAEFGTANSREKAPSSHPRTQDTLDLPAKTLASTTCPFCHEKLQNPSAELSAMISLWQQRRKSGMVLRPTDTLAVCQRHRDEQDVIPHGKSQGWPMQLDFRQLRRRITQPQSRYMGVLQDRIIAPEQSRWFHAARARREAMGKKMSASVHQIDLFHERQSGYYGERGWELFHDILFAAFVQDPLMTSLDLKQNTLLDKIAPLDAPEFVDQVLLPELVCMLIQDDMGGIGKATYEDAIQVQQESQKFGVAMYASDAADASAVSDTRRSSGSWIGASPKRAKKMERDDDDPFVPGGSSRARSQSKYVQQTLPVRRRSTRNCTPPATTYQEDSSSSDSDEVVPVKVWHQQRLFLPTRREAASSSPRPKPRPAHRSGI